jgi:hypothetical protein
MRRWVLFAAFVVAGCGAPRYSEPLPDPIIVPDPPPKAVVRLPVEFRFKDYQGGKEYLFRRYTANDPSSIVRDDRLGKSKTSIATLHAIGEQQLEIVTVIEAGALDERLATDAERAYALGVLQSEWVKRGQDELMTYHIDVVERERRMRADLIDERLQYTARVIEDLKEEKFNLEADRDSIQATGYKATPDHMQFLDKEINKRSVLLAVAQTEHAMLKYQKQLRDSEIRRSSAPLRIREYLPVKDLMEAGIAPDRIESEVKSKVHPESWKNPNAVCRVVAGYLELSNTRAAIDQARDYLNALRTRKAEGR